MQSGTPNGGNAPHLAKLSDPGQQLDVFDCYRPASFQPDPTHQSPVARSPSREASLCLARGGELIAAGLPADAIAPLQRAVALDPLSVAAQHDLGLAYLLCERLAEAIACLHQAVALQPSHARAHFNLAAALERNGRDGEAIAEYRAATRLNPKWAEAHSKLGDLLLARGQREEAVDCYRRSAAASPHCALGRVNRVKALVVDEQMDQAEVLIARIHARDAADAPAQSRLGDLLAELGRFDEAAACYERTIAVEPQHAMAYFGLIHCKRITESDRPLISRMQAQLADGLSGRQAIATHFALGKAFEDLQDYAAAMRHFDAANRQRHLAPFNRTALARHVEGLLRRFSPEFFREHARIGVEDETPLFILGMPRSGTTLLEQIVSSHPDVIGGGELSFWMNRLPAWEERWTRDPQAAHTAELAAKYSALLRQIGPHAMRVTDKMPFNFFAIGLIRLLFPRARIIHCRRHPIDTCLSIYSTLFASPFAWASDRDDLAFYYRQYERLMAHWQTVLPADRFTEVDYEELVRTPEDTTRRLIDFCGLAWDDVCLAPQRNRRTVATASKWQARQPIYTGAVERWRRYEPWLGALRGLIDQPSPTGPE